MEGKLNHKLKLIYTRLKEIIFVKDDIAIIWFRNDLRLSANPALYKASQHTNTLPIYIFDNSVDSLNIGGASQVWLYNSLVKLRKSLGGKLSIYSGSPLNIFKLLIKKFNITALYWNRCYSSYEVERDLKIKEYLINQDISVESSNGSLLWEPWEIAKSDGTPYKVFTPFYRKACLVGDSPRTPIETPNLRTLIVDESALGYIRKIEAISRTDWANKIIKYWNIGEKSANRSLDKFIKNDLKNYKEGRNYPIKHNVSKLSPHLRFGEISPNTVWHAIKSIKSDDNSDHFCNELGWREFAYSLLYYNSKIKTESLQLKFNKFNWRKDYQEYLSLWKKGFTGIPMVDAGMRELWKTGYTR